MSQATERFKAAFAVPRTPRSLEYRMGVLDALRLNYRDIEKIQCPYAPGTAQADAYYAGNEEGHRLASAAMPPKVP